MPGNVILGNALIIVFGFVCVFFCLVIVVAFSIFAASFCVLYFSKQMLQVTNTGV